MYNYLIFDMYTFLHVQINSLILSYVVNNLTMVNRVFNKYIIIKYKNSLNSLRIFGLFFTVNEIVELLLSLNIDISMGLEVFIDIEKEVFICKFF
ncbi:hypothetical protein CFB3_04060 [Clostridium folliculivorans]|uniref:Uncharacterized protein n=1 Tax=Clostridium folliculivorans TaxID=2886038 RepID=A0A9W5Y2A8_9CLOT|nr:hypothetical protein CFOLD11_21050 [Clostridium folliculivorans]GKU28300.1 hypothetical protein CFB3_04060 [Clostridium folliculivorans]